MPARRLQLRAWPVDDGAMVLKPLACRTLQRLHSCGARKRGLPMRPPRTACDAVGMECRSIGWAHTLGSHTARVAAGKDTLPSGNWAPRGQPQLVPRRALSGGAQAAGRAAVAKPQAGWPPGSCAAPSLHCICQSVPHRPTRAAASPDPRQGNPKPRAPAGTAHARSTPWRPPRTSTPPGAEAMAAQRRFQGQPGAWRASPSHDRWWGGAPPRPGARRRSHRAAAASATARCPQLVPSAPPPAAGC